AGQAMVFGRHGLRFPVSDAALANGVAIHSFELDDYHNAKIHPGAVVIAAAVPVAQRVGATGKDLITSIVAGYEAMIRVALALNPGPARARGWHLTGVCGPFGAAAATSVLMNLNREETGSAFGLAGTQGAGLFAFNSDGSMSKRLHPGRAAQSGVMAAELAAGGLQGPVAILESKDGGFLATFSDVPKQNQVVLDLGCEYRLTRVCFKPYPCCGSLHACVQAAISLVKRRGATFTPSAAVRVGIPELVKLQCGYDYRPSTALHAQMSLRYCVAVALLEGRLGPEQFEPFKLKAPEIVTLAQRLEVVVDPELSVHYPDHFLGWVDVNDN